MGKIVVDVQYNADNEIDQILSMAEQYVNMNEDKEKIKDYIQNRMQDAFNEGRTFQKKHGAIDPPL